MHHCTFQLKDRPIVESVGPKSKQSKKFTEKSVGFNCAVFLGFLRLIPAHVTWKSTRVSVGHVSISKWQALVHWFVTGGSRTPWGYEAPKQG